MPRINPAQTTVTSVEVGGGKAVVECKGENVTYTLELREISGMLPYLYEGAKVAFSVDLQSTLLKEDDMYTTSTSLSSSSKPEPEAEFTAIKQDGFANLSVKDTKDMMGLPSYETTGPAPTTGTITKTS